MRERKSASRRKAGDVSAGKPLPRRRHCCAGMRYQSKFTCDQHPNPYDCNKYLIAYVPLFDDYGLVLHDMEARVRIEFCPWCGTKLPPSRQREYFETLEQLGFRDALYTDSDLPVEQRPGIPAEFRSDLWWRKRPKKGDT